MRPKIDISRKTKRSRLLSVLLNDIFFLKSTIARASQNCLLRTYDYACLDHYARGYYGGSRPLTNQSEGAK